MKKTILLTGGTGYIGHGVAQRILNDHGNTTLNFWIHSKDQSEFRAKSEKLLLKFPGFESRIKFSSGELGAPAPFEDVDWSEVTSVIHIAAVTNFNVKEEEANTVNRDGTIKLLEKSRTAPMLEKFTYISTVYASGLREGAVEEKFFDNSFGFANHYERSKWEAEEYIRTKCQDLPWEISRVATVISHDETGLVIQHNAVHNTLKLLFYGLISLMPGRAGTPVYLVTGDEVARAIAALHMKAPVHQIFNITHDRENSLTLGKLVDFGYEVFNADPTFKSRRILKPLFTEEKAFNSLVESVQGFGGQVLAQAVSSVAPFGRQLYIQKDMVNKNMRAHYDGFLDYDAKTVIKNTCENLIKTGFKKG